MINIRGVSAKKEIPIVLSVLVLLVLSGWYARHHRQQQNTAKQAVLAPPPGWTKYQSQKYGFQFIYPRSWGPINVIQIPQPPGKSYSISFAFASEATSKPGYGDIFLIKMDSNDASTKTCNSNNKQQCTVTYGYSKKNIENILSGDKKGIVKYDDSSFAKYSYSAYSELEIDQIVNLPKINVTAARATFQRYSTTIGCSMDKLQARVKTGCIGQALYSDVSHLLKSLQPL